MHCKNMKKLREILGMNQKQFAQALGCAQTTYNNYETGIREPSLDFLVMTADKFDIPVDFLLQRGPFTDCEKLFNCKQEILKILSKFYENDFFDLFPKLTNNELDYIRLLAIILAEIKFEDKNIKLSPTIPQEVLRDLNLLNVIGSAGQPGTSRLTDEAVLVALAYEKADLKNKNIARQALDLPQLKQPETEATVITDTHKTAV